MSKASETQASEKRQYSCMYCGYIYDEGLGDPENGVAPGTLWEDIPEDWCCPACSAEKDGFQKE